MAPVPDSIVARFINRAGFSSAATHRGGTADVVAFAVAVCESGLNAQAHNTRGEDSRGIFQINWNNVWEGQIPGVSNGNQLFDPELNAKAAYFIYQQAGNSFKDWTCYNNGAYLFHLSRANKAFDEFFAGGGQVPNPSSPLDSLPDITAPFDQIGNLVSFITDRENWLRVAMFVGGGALLLVGLIVFMGQSKTLRSAVTKGVV